MKAKPLILILLALGSGSVAAVGATQVLEGKKGPKVQMVKVLVSASDTSIGKPFSEKNVRIESWPKDKVPPGAIQKLAALEGRYAAQRMFAGEPILQKKIMDTPTRSSAIDIPKGYRVISVKVQIDTAVSGLLKPGDRVDLIIYLRKGGDIREDTTRTLLKNVTVFAVDHKTESSAENAGKPISAKTISLLVTPSQAQKVMLAKQKGSLHLALRSPNDENTDEESGETSIKDLIGSDDATVAEITDDFDDDFDDSDDEQVVRRPKRTWDMILHTPDGVEQVHWSDQNGLPDHLAGGGRFAAPAVENTENPAQTGNFEFDGLDPDTFDADSLELEQAAQ